MADLSFIQSSGSTILVGSDSTGNETFPAAVDSAGNQQVIINNVGQKTMAASVPVVLASDQTVILISKTDGFKSTYSASSKGTISSSSATDIFTFYGNATKTVKILKITLSAAALNATLIDVQLIKRSTNNTGGTSASIAGVAYDSTNIASTSTLRSYTTNATTLGTSLGAIRSDKFIVAVTAPPGSAISPVSTLIYEFGANFGQALVLRGINEGVAINLGSATIAGSSFDISLEWTEE